MNTWVLLRELPELIEGAKEDGVRRAAATLQRNYSDSVDALVLTSEAEVIMHQPEMALPHRNRTQAYLTLLRRSLEAFGGKRRLNAEANPISMGRKWKEVSHTFRTSGTDAPDYTLVEIDTTLSNTTGYYTLRYGWARVRRQVRLNCLMAIQT